MGKEIVYCELCGERLLEQEFEKGRAITFLNKNYCSKCKQSAVKNVSLNDLTDDDLAAEARKGHSSAVLKGVRSPTSHPTPRPHAHPTPRRPLQPIRRSKGPWILAAAIAALILIVVLVLALAPPGNPSPKSSGSETKPQEREKPEVGKAEKAWQDLQTTAERARNSGDYDEVLRRIDVLKTDLAGSRYEAQIEKIKTEFHGYRRIGEMLAEAQRRGTNDPEFLKYSEVVARYDAAAAEAERIVSPRAADVRNARRDYVDRYESAADKRYMNFHEQLQGHVESREWANAIAVIDKHFPASFRKSSVWRTRLESVYQECEQKAKDKTIEEKTDPGPERRKDDSVEPPPAGQWVEFHGSDKWERLTQQGEKGESWLFKGGVLWGRSSRDQTDEERYHDLVATIYGGFGDVEMTFQARTKKGVALHLLLRLATDKSPMGLVPIKLLLSPDWWEVRVVLEGASVRIRKGPQPEKNFEFPDAEPTGRIGFALEPGSEIEIKELKIKRK